MGIFDILKSGVQSGKAMFDNANPMIKQGLGFASDVGSNIDPLSLVTKNMFSGFFPSNARAEENKPQQTILNKGQQTSLPQDQGFNPLGFLGGALGGVGDFVRDNPELSTGLITGGIGMAAGVNPGEAFGTGGMVTMNMMDKKQAELMKNQEFENRLRVAAMGNQASSDPYMQAVENVRKMGYTKPKDIQYRAGRLMQGIL